MLDVRAGKIQVQRGNQSWRKEEGGGSREDDGKPCWLSSFRGGARGERRSRGGQGEGSEGLIEEERSGTRLTLRPCRMHKPGTRDRKSSQKHNTRKRAHQRKPKNNKQK